MLPAGLILIWSGAIGDIPAGFVLCDGTNGTPDLRNRFVIAAGDTYAVNDTGGALTHNHAFTSDGHLHDLTIRFPFSFAPGVDNSTTLDVDSGITDAGSSLPPYFSLAYIMKT